MLTALIDKQDNFEIVRDQIASLLALESKNQGALATKDGQDPADFTFRMFIERVNPWESFSNEDDISPIVNIWFDSSNYDQAASDIVERQASQTTYNIDIYGYGTAESDPNGGQFMGDEMAARESQRAYRLVRNILMAAENTYLQLQGTVWQRWPQSVNNFQPQFDNQAVERVQAVRLVLAVTFNEFSPQVDSVELELLSVLVNRAEDGELLVQADFEYPLT